MVNSKKMLNMFAPAKLPKQVQTNNAGTVGYDNIRENIDPHIKTKVLSTKEIEPVRRHIHLTTETFVQGASSPTAAEIGHFAVYRFSHLVKQTAVNTFHVPEDWDGVSDFLCHVHWAPDDAGSGGVVWDIDYKAVAANANETIDGTDRNLTVTDQAESLQYEHLKTENMIIPASDISDLDAVGICISREVSDPADDYGAGANLIMVEILYVKNKMGEDLLK